MDRVFEVLEKTVNKSAINDFRTFVNRFNTVTKWFMSSDYCIDDKGKPNDVITFVVYPYIMDFHQWSQLIGDLQKTDLKKCRRISENFCSFSHEGVFFSFNFIIKNNSFINKWKDVYVLHKLIDDCVDMIENKWKKNTHHMIDYYSELEARLKALKKEMSSKNFNYKLLSRTIITVFLASYIKYLLIREVDKIEIFSWLSDRDKITGCYDSIYEVFYAIISHGICSKYLSDDKYLHIKDCIPGNVEKEMFYDEIVRVADFICGALADYDLQTKRVSKEKHCTLIEDVIADNSNIVILIFSHCGISRCSHKKKSRKFDINFSGEREC